MDTPDSPFPQDASYEALRTRSREISEDPIILNREFGQRRAQVVYAPSFEDQYAWDIRETKGGLALFRSDVIAELRSDLRYKLRDYDEIAADPVVLGGFLGRLNALSLPFIMPSQISGLDGTHFELAVFGSHSSSIRFQWWCEPPAHWHELGSLATGMINCFLPLPLRFPPPPPA